MATSAHLVLDNFYWRIETITPTNLTDCRNYYREIDGNTIKQDFPDGTAGIRRFFVEWTDSDSDVDATDHDNREAHHNFIVTVCYPGSSLPWRRLHKLILQDRHDLIKQLRDDDNKVGYNASNTTTDIGLMHRFRGGDELIKEEDEIWRLRIQFRCLIEENE